MEIDISRTVLLENFSLINFEKNYVDFSCDILISLFRELAFRLARQGETSHLRKILNLMTTKEDKIKKKKRKRKEKNDRVEFDYLGRAVSNRLFTGAIPLLFDAGAFACCVSTLGRFAPL